MLRLRIATFPVIIVFISIILAILPSHFPYLYLRRTPPHPAIVTIRENTDYIRVLFYSYSTTITELGAPPNLYILQNNILQHNIISYQIISYHIICIPFRGAL